MNYEKQYNLLIEKADNRCIIPGVYKEKHHIIPKCIGGENENYNIIELLPEEHFIAHQLLAKMFPKKHKLIYACNMMTVNAKYQKRNNKQYKWIKEKISELQKGVPRSENTKRKLSEAALSRYKNKFNHPSFGKKHNDDTKKKIREAALSRYKNKFNHPKFGTKHTDESKKKMSLAHTGKTFSFEHREKLSVSRKGRKHTEAAKQNMSDALKGRTLSKEHRKKLSDIGKNTKKFECPHCGIVTNKLNFNRWHNDNCKHRVKI